MQEEVNKVIGTALVRGEFDLIRDTVSNLAAEIENVRRIHGDVDTLSFVYLPQTIAIDSF